MIITSGYQEIWIVIYFDYKVYHSFYQYITNTKLNILHPVVSYFLK